MSGSNLEQGRHWLILGWFNLAQYQEWSLSCPSQFFDNKRQLRTILQEKELSQKCSTLEFERLFVAAAPTIYQCGQDWELKGRSSLHFCFTFESIAAHDLI